jgi:hypothetical protein
MRLVCLPRHPAVAYLLLVRRNSAFLIVELPDSLPAHFRSLRERKQMPTLECRTWQASSQCARNAIGSRLCKSPASDTRGRAPRPSASDAWRRVAGRRFLTRAEFSRAIRTRSDSKASLLLTQVPPYHGIERLTSRCSEWLAGVIPTFEMTSTLYLQHGAPSPAIR